jgi:uncharacterized protein YdhG (YjbR/CyaY superfamily)
MNKGILIKEIDKLKNENKKLRKTISEAYRELEKIIKSSNLEKCKKSAKMLQEKMILDLL